MMMRLYQASERQVLQSFRRVVPATAPCTTPRTIDDTTCFRRVSLDLTGIPPTRSSFRMVFITGDQAAEVLQPTVGAFDFPSPAVTPQLGAILQRRLAVVAAMGTNQVNTTPLKSLAQRVIVCSFVVDQPFRFAAVNASRQQGLGQRDLVGTGTFGLVSQLQTVAVDEDHHLGTLAALCLADAFTAFFAEAIVPSAFMSVPSIFPRPSSQCSRRDQAFWKMPDSTHWRNRRQQIVGEPKLRGTSFHRAPVRSPHKMPSMQLREVARGRAPLGEGRRSRNKSFIRCHCSSVSCGWRSVLDPPGASTAPLQRDLCVSDLHSWSLLRGTKRLKLVLGD